MATILQYVLYAVVLVTVLSVLVAAHELGHYLFARLFGMGAEEFAIGMGKPQLVTWLRRTYTVPLPADTPYREGEMVENDSAAMGLEGGTKRIRSEVVRTHRGLALAETTDFTIRPWPLGGFVRIKGMMPEEDGSETKIPGGFYSKPPWQRFIVLLAGPAFSVLAGMLLLTGLLLTKGVMEPQKEAVLGIVTKEMPAWNAGLRPNDRIVAVNGKPVSRFYDVTLEIRDKPDQQAVLEYERDGVRKTVEITPYKTPQPSPVLDENFEPTLEKRVQGKLGIAPLMFRRYVGAGEAWSKAWQMPVLTVKGLWITFTQPSKAKENLGGPGAIAVATADAVDRGLESVLTFAAMLSISVGIFNLLPIFPLDGGQMAVAIAEMLRGGKRLSMRVQNLVGTVGFALVAVLFLSVILLDVQRFIGPKPPQEKEREVVVSDKMKEQDP